MTDEIDNLINEIENNETINIEINSKNKKSFWEKTIFSDWLKNYKEEKEIKRELMKEAKREALKELKPELVKQMKQKELDKMSGKNSMWNKVGKEFEKIGKKDIGGMFGTNRTTRRVASDGISFERYPKKKRKSNNNFEDKVRKML